MVSLLERYGWHEWSCHTNFSFLAGASHPHECLERAMDFGYRGLAVTDFDGVYGLARAHLDRQRLVKERGERGTPAQGESAANLRLFHGVEMHLAVDHDLPIVFQDTLVLIARTHRGYRNLCALVTFSHREGKTYANVPLAELLRQPVDDLIAIQPMRGLIRRVGSPAADTEEPRTSTALERRCADLRAHFGGRFYFAVSRHLHPSEDHWIRPTMALAARLGAPCLLTQDAFFHEPERKDLSDVLHAIRCNRPLDAAVAQMFANSERCLHQRAGIERRFADLPIYAAALQASRDLADSCAFDLTELRYCYPKEMIPAPHSAQSFLETLSWQAARERYGDSLPAKMSGVLSHELQLIARLGFADYFLTVWDIVRWARERGILCQGRGSAANSAVCFVLGVTAVDPALFDLLFERFISVERGDPPDIDVDFEHERREEVIQYIYERYGRPQAAMVANVITFRSKGALRATGKALGIPEDRLGEVSTLLEARYFRSSGAENVLDHLKLDLQKSTAVAARAADEADAAAAARSPHPAPAAAGDAPAPSGDDDDSELAAIPWQLWGEMSERLKGFPRHLGIHSGGFMLADKPLDWLVPQEPATMAGRTVIQWSKDDIEGLGFFKIDVLALGMLTAIRKTFTAIDTHYGRRLTLATIPHDDPSTYAMIQRADTVGTFQIESRAQMSMLPRLRPRNFYDLVVEVAIIRPGPIQGGMIHPYLRRRDGLEPVVFPDERLRPILARTLGIPIFQEQVMRIAIAVGGFSAGEANELRRHMGAWSMKGDMGPWLGRLAEGMRGNGLAEEFVQTILSQMRGFADYGFPESHAVSFALLAYASSYLKCHYPGAFFMALLNSQPMGFYSPHALLQSAKRDGVQILPVCVNHSDWDCTLEAIPPAEPGEACLANGRPVVYALRLGLRYVNGLRRVGADALLSQRAPLGGSFRDLEQILKTVTLYRNDLTALAAANAFACFGLERKASIWLAEAAPFCPVLEDVEQTVAWAPETSMQRIEQDFAATTTTLGPHPVAVIRDEHWCYPLPQTRLVRSVDLTKQTNGRTVDVFGMVLVRQAPPSAHGMVFFSLEDETGFINLVFTPQLYARHFKLIESQAFLCARGRLQKQNETHSIMVTQVFEPSLKRADVIAIEPRPETAASQYVPLTERELQKSRNYL